MAPISDIERQVFTDIYETYSGKLYGVCLHYVHDHAVAEDLLHDSFIVIFSSLGSLRDSTRLEPWMRSIVRNIALKHLREVQKMPGTSIDNISEPPFDDNVVNITEIPLDELLKVIDDLPEQYGNVFRLSVLEGLSHKEIGAILGIAPHSSSSNLARAKQLLRSIISRNWGIILTFCLCIFAVLFMARPEKTETMTADNQVSRITDTENPEVMIAELSPAKAIRPLTRRNSMTTTEPCSEDIDIQENDPELPHTSGSDDATISGTEPKKVNETDVYDDISEPEETRRKAGKTFRFSFSGAIGNSMNGMQMMLVPGSGTPGYGSGSGFRPPGTGGDITSSVDSLRQSKAIAASEESGNGHSTLIRKYRHSMPVSFTANATWMITDRWMLSSGLRYTYLHSDVTQGIRTYDQEIHYLGIPLKASWTFWKAASFNAYTSGGVSFEIPLGGHLGSERLDLSCQWSAGISVGLQYNITPHVGIYIEPELYRYFDNGSQVQTIRTERPLNFSLPAGIKFSW